jgi:hypothetical protein
MVSRTPHRSGHTLMEVLAAVISSTVLMAGLGSVMLVARQIAFTPAAPTNRLDAAEVVNELATDLRCAILVMEEPSRMLDFVVADRDGDGAAERIRYEWSGTTGDPLTRSLNGGPPAVVLNSVHEFYVAPTIQTTTLSLPTTTTSSEVFLAGNTNAQSGTDRDVTLLQHAAQRINPAAFSAAAPANALAWNATRIEAIARNRGATTGTLLVQIRSAGDPYDGPTAHVLGQVGIPEASLTSGYGWNTAIFSGGPQHFALHRRYAIAFAGLSGSGHDAQLFVNDGSAGGVLQSDDGGGTWQYMSSRQMYYRLYGTFTVPGPTYEADRQTLSHISLRLQRGAESHARVDAAVPLANRPELLAGYWRTDFDGDPTAQDANGDGAADWAQAGGGTLDMDELSSGIWTAGAALESRPLNDFSGITVVEARCRNTSIGGNGAVVRINADWQGGLHAPLYFTLQLQADGTQTLSLYGKPSDASSVLLYSRPSLSNDFVRVRMTVVPEHDVVNLAINDEDLGTFTYPTYAPAANDRFATVYADTSAAQFDYVELRTAAE